MEKDYSTDLISMEDFDKIFNGETVSDINLSNVFYKVENIEELMVSALVYTYKLKPIIQTEQGRDYLFGENGKLIDIYGKLESYGKNNIKVSELIELFTGEEKLKDKFINYLFGNNGKFIEFFDKHTADCINVPYLKLYKIIDLFTENAKLKEPFANYLLRQNGNNKNIDILISMCKDDLDFYDLSKLIKSLNKIEYGKEYLFGENGQNGKIVELFRKLEESDRYFSDLSELINTILTNEDLKEKGIEYLFGKNGKLVELFEKTNDFKKNPNYLIELIRKFSLENEFRRLLLNNNGIPEIVNKLGDIGS